MWHWWMDDSEKALHFGRLSGTNTLCGRSWHSNSAFAVANHRVNRCIKQLLERACFSTKWLNLIKQFFASLLEKQTLQSNKLRQLVCWIAEDIHDSREDLYLPCINKGTFMLKISHFLLIVDTILCWPDNDIYIKK